MRKRSNARGTVEEFSMVKMITTIDPAIEKATGWRAHVHNAAKFLEGRVGETSVDPRAEWTLETTTSGSPELHVRVTDEGASAEAKFGLHEIANFQLAKMRLYDVWIDLLGERFELHGVRYRELANSSTEE